MKNPQYFRGDGSPRFVRVYYDRRCEFEPYTAIFTRTADLLDGWRRLALGIGYYGNYYHVEIEPRNYPGRPVKWAALPELVQKTIIHEYRTIHERANGGAVFELTGEPFLS